MRVKNRLGALWLVWRLLAVELFGAFMLLSIFSVGIVGLVAVCWTSPNAFLFYKQRATFAELETQRRATNPASCVSPSFTTSRAGTAAASWKAGMEARISKKAATMTARKRLI